MDIKQLRSNPTAVDRCRTDIVLILLALAIPTALIVLTECTVTTSLYSTPVYTIAGILYGILDPTLAATYRHALVLKSTHSAAGQLLSAHHLNGTLVVQ